MGATLNPVPSVYWGTFFTAMMADAGYQRITISLLSILNAASNWWTIATLQDVMTVYSPDPTQVKLYWNTMIGNLSILNKPTTTEVNRWKGYVTSTNVPITFNSDGTIA
jgi:hypothetical protein